MTTTLLDTQNTRSPRSLSPVSVADRIALFETMQHNPHSITAASNPVLVPIKKVLADGKQLELFLEAIGEAHPPLAHTSPNLRRIAAEWWQTVSRNIRKQQHDDTQHLNLSFTHSLVEAALDPKCAHLEVQALEELIVLKPKHSVVVSPRQSLHPPVLEKPLMEQPPLYSCDDDDDDDDAKPWLEDTSPDENQPRQSKHVTFQMDKAVPRFLRTPFTYRIEEEEEDENDVDVAPVFLSSLRSDMFYYR
jgi:hypothetical protein